MLKKLLFLLSITLIFGCTMGESEVKESTLVYKSFFYDIHKIKIDSVDYLVAITQKGVSIIKK
jgi:hypothetical protein